MQKHRDPIDQLARDIGATLDEVQLLMQNDVFAAKDIENWAYSEAWVPAESGRTRIPTLFDLVDGKEDIEHNDSQCIISDESTDVLHKVVRRNRKKAGE